MLVSGVIAGFLAGMLGIGGGIVTVPVLFTAFGLIDVPAHLQMHLAVATSLAIIIPTATVSALSHLAEEAVSMRLVIHWGPWVLGGAIFGTLVASHLDTRALLIFFSVMATVMGLKFIIPFDSRAIGGRPPRGAAGRAIGLTIGTFSSVMGIGGATFSVPAMTLFAMPIHRAVGTAAALGLFISVPAVIGYGIAGWGTPDLPPLSVGYVNLMALVIMAPLSMALAPIGARFAHRLTARRLSLAFGIFLLIAAVRMVLPLF